jgi:hypothetical protein
MTKLIRATMIETLTASPSPYESLLRVRPIGAGWLREPILLEAGREAKPCTGGVPAFSGILCRGGKPSPSSIQSSLGKVFQSLGRCQEQMKSVSGWGGEVAGPAKPRSPRRFWHLDGDPDRRIEPARAEPGVLRSGSHPQADRSPVREAGSGRPLTLSTLTRAPGGPLVKYLA